MLELLLQNAVVGYDTVNIGDDMQSLAAEQYFTGRVRRLPRERLDDPRLLLRRHDMIMNGWFMSKPKHWPPVRTINPLVISMHVSAKYGRVERMLGPKGLAFFKRQEKRFGVGARDTQTLKLLRDAGVDAYFSGCLTMTMKRPDVARTDANYVVDVHPAVEEKLRTSVGLPFERLTHAVPSSMQAADRDTLVRQLRRTYASARLVITSRIHVAFPCLAMGTPVLMIHPRVNHPRFVGIVEHLHIVSVEDFLADRFDYDFAGPTPNKTTHLPLAAEMKTRCEQFVARH